MEKTPKFSRDETAVLQGMGIALDGTMVRVVSNLPGSDSYFVEFFHANPLCLPKDALSRTPRDETKSRLIIKESCLVPYTEKVEHIFSKLLQDSYEKYDSVYGKCEQRDSKLAFAADVIFGFNTQDLEMNEVLAARTLWNAIGMVTYYDEAFILGGATLFKDAYHTADKLILTEIDASFANTSSSKKYFPDSLQDKWEVTSRVQFHNDPLHKYSRAVYERRKRSV